MWVLVAAGAVMAPALAHGSSLGPYDLLTNVGLTHRPGVSIHNDRTADQILLFIPWTSVAWTQVHHGQLPLWNPYSLLGMPLAFNWESAPFGIPALIGYLVPLHLAYTAGVLATLVIAGTGVYVLCRVLDLSVLACAMAATVFELSGPFMGYLGWTWSSVMSWAGWLFALAILIVRGRHRARDVALFAVAFAFMVYAGYPEASVILGLALLLFFIVFLGMRLPIFKASGGPILRPLCLLSVAVAAGIALSAPLALPGLQLAGGSIRTTKILGLSRQTLGTNYLVTLFDQGFNGYPWHGSQFFAPRTDGLAFDYLGITALVLAVVAMAVGRRKPEVRSFGALAIVAAVLVFAVPLMSLVDRVPGASSVRWYDALGPFAMAMAVLAGIGIDLVIKTNSDRPKRWLGAGFTAAGIGVLVVWIATSGSLPSHSADASIRAKSFIWPAVEVLVGLVSVGVLALARRRRDRTSRSWFSPGRVAAIVLLVGETAFLVAAGAPIFSSSPTYLAPTPAISALQRAVGTSVVGLDPCSRNLGIDFNVNVAYGVDEFAVYDPATPLAYVSAWRSATGEGSLYTSTHSSVCPSVRTVRAARLFGISYVLVRHRARGPKGAIFVRRVDREDLYRIPGVAAATLTAIPPNGRVPSDSAPGTPIPVSHPTAASWKLVTSSPSANVLRLRLTDEPGWRATIDGRPLTLTTFAGIMLQAKIPPGRHTIQLQYWPETFSAGIVLAAIAVVGLSLALVVELRRKGRRPHADHEGTSR